MGQFVPTLPPFKRHVGLGPHMETQVYCYCGGPPKLIRTVGIRCCRLGKGLVNAFTPCLYPVVHLLISFDWGNCAPFQSCSPGTWLIPACRTRVWYHPVPDRIQLMGWYMANNNKLIGPFIKNISIVSYYEKALPGLTWLEINFFFTAVTLNLLQIKTTPVCRWCCYLFYRK